MIVREADRNDMPSVLVLIKELATFENAANEVELTLTNLQEDGFGNTKLFNCLVAEQGNEIVGMALYYYHFFYCFV